MPSSSEEAGTGSSAPASSPASEPVLETCREARQLASAVLPLLGSYSQEQLQSLLIDKLPSEEELEEMLQA